jgi:hypothetical protein
MSFRYPLTEFPARIEATRSARKSALESRNSKFQDCGLRGLHWPTGPASRSIRPLGTRQTAVERLTGMEQFVPEATICMKKNELSQKTPKWQKAYTIDYKAFVVSSQIQRRDSRGN